MPRNQLQRMVLAAVRTIGGIYMFGRVMPVWSVVLVEFCFPILWNASTEARFPSNLPAKTLTRKPHIRFFLKQP